MSPEATPNILERTRNTIAEHIPEVVVAAVAALAVSGSTEGKDTEAFAQPAPIAEIAAAPKPMKPQAIMRGIYAAYSQTYGTDNTVDRRSAYLSRRRLVVKGKCHPGRRFPDTKNIVDSAKSLSWVYCNGDSLTMPRHQLQSSMEKIDYRSFLTKLGQTAARKAGFADNTHGETTYITANRSTLRPKATVYYALTPGITKKQLKTLTMTQVGKSVKVSKTWHSPTLPT